MSQFQLLPFDIVDQIVKYYCASRNSIKARDKHRALALMHTCHSWRTVFVGAAFDYLILDGRNLNSLFYYKQCYFCINPLGYPLDQIVKTLQLGIWSWADLLSGKVLEWIKTSGFADLRLTRLDHFVFEMYLTHPSVVDFTAFHSEPMHEIVSLFQLLRQMMPSMRTVVFKGAEFIWPVGMEKTFPISKHQVSDLLRGVDSITTLCSGVFVYLNHTDLFANGNLTSLSYKHCSDVDTASFLKVLRLNAATIVNIDIKCLPLTHVQHIIYCDNGEPLVYPRVSSLTLTNIQKNNYEFPPLINELIELSPDTCHFPVLKSLDLSRGYYPFNGSILNCGVNLILEELRLSLFTSDISNDPVQSLLSTQLVNLKKITLFSYNLTHFDPFAGVVDNQQHPNICRFLQTLLQPAVSLSKIRSLIPVDSSLYLDEPSCLKFNSLRYLHFSSGNFSFTDVLHIIQKAPYPKRLTCNLDIKTPKVEGVSQVKLPKHMETLYPINSHFFELRVKCCYHKDIKSLVKTAVLLAIGCPNFSVMLFGFHCGDLIRDHIKDVLRTKTFKNYSDAGQRILNRIENNNKRYPFEDY